ncbi:MAG: Cohesin domain protein [Bacteroidetes bacterium ADurb.Bin174]|nr:MAG: Cohesin domain protein [Bacteroidetes bacterium ADurb.Bin174]
MKHIKYYIAFCLLAFMPLVGLGQTPAFSLPTGLQMTVGETIDVQLSVDTDLSPHNVLAYTFAVSYNSNLLQVKNVQYDVKLQNFSNVANTQQAGKVTLSGAATSKIEGNGTLITLTFEALAAGNASLNFVVAECVLNEGAPTASYQNGNVVIANKPTIKVSPNTSFLAVGQTSQCSVSGNVTNPVTWGVTNPLVASVSETGLVTALAHGSTKVFAVDAAGVRDTTDGVFNVTAIRLSIPTDLQQWQGWEITVPINTTDFSSLNILSGQFTLTYNANVLQFLGVDKAETLLENASVSAGETVGGNLNLAFASAQPLGASSAELVKLRFQVLSNATSGTGLNFSNVIFNEDIAAVTDNGSFTPKKLPVLTISPASASLVAGDSLLFTASNGNLPYTWTVSDGRVAKIRQDGWLIGYEGGTTDLTVTDAVGATKTISNIIVSDMRMYFSADTLEQVETITYTDCFTDSIPIGRPAISAIEGEISVSDSNVKILDIETDSTFTTGWQKVITRVNDQRIKFYLAGATPFREKGIAFKLKTELLSAFKEYHRSDVRFHNTQANERTPDVKFIDGAIEGKIFTEQDKTICLGESTGVLTVPDAEGKTISRWRIRVRRPVPTEWITINNTTATYTHTPDKLGEWEYVAEVNGVLTKVANILVKTIPDVTGIIRGDTVFCNVPQVLRYVVQRRPTATEYRWNYTGSGVILHANQNILDLEITSEVTPGNLEMRTANFCGESEEKLVLELKPKIQPASFSFDSEKIYYNQDTIAFTDTSVGALAWEWSVTPESGALFVDGTTVNSQHPKVKFTQAGDFTIKLKTTNSCRVDSFAQTVVIHQFKNGELEVDKNADCFGSTFRVELTQSTGVVAVWQIKEEDAAEWVDLDMAPTTVINYTPQTAGKYYLRAKLAGDRGYSDVISITMYPEVDVRVTSADNVLTALAENATYQWLDCNNNFEPIEGETNQSFTATQNGSYAVEVTQNNCTDTSDCYDITSAGILENTFGNDIAVYPNPTDDILHINLGETLSEFTISITDVSGKLLKQSTYKNIQKLELNLDVQPGFYLLTIHSESKKAIIRLIKN